MTEEKRKDFNRGMKALEDIVLFRYMEAALAIMEYVDISEVLLEPMITVIKCESEMERMTLREEVVPEWLTQEYDKARKEVEEFEKKKEEVRAHNEYVRKNRHKILKKFINEFVGKANEFKQTINVAEEIDSFQLSRACNLLGLVYELISELIWDLDNCSTPESETFFQQSVIWYKKAGFVFSDSSSDGFSDSLNAITHLAEYIIEGKWHPTDKDRKDIDSLFGKALAVYNKMASGERQKIYRAFAKYYSDRNDFIKAKEYYEMGKQDGLDCESELEAVDLALGVANTKNNAMQRFIQQITFCGDLAVSVQKKLKKEFGGSWKALQAGTRECLITGFATYILLYKNCYAAGIEDMDYSSVIVPVMKACEIEFSRFFFDRFLEWLQVNKVPAERFDPGKCDFVEYEIKPEDFEFVSSKEGFDYYRVQHTPNGIRYVAKEKKGVFGIGKLKYWIRGNDRLSISDPPKANPIFVDYLDELFSPEAFGVEHRRQEIEEYLLTLTQMLSYLAGRIRNPAAHNDTMPFWKANYCCNVVVMVDRVLQKFIAKIKPEYLE
ncbi:MAG: hypothetical protein IKN50_02630 [Clostridia bacterium]|nr:hypothetical protein [Clostridia bacterium]